MSLEIILLICVVLLSVVVFFNLAISLALVREVKSQSRAVLGGPKVGTRAPDFNALDLDGESVTLKEYQGRMLGILFVSPSCESCKTALSELSDDQWRSSDNSTRSILVASDGTPLDTRAMLKALRVTTRTISVPRSSNTFVQDFGFRATPAFCILDHESKVIASGHPGVRESAWSQLIDSQGAND